MSDRDRQNSLSVIEIHIDRLQKCYIIDSVQKIVTFENYLFV